MSEQTPSSQATRRRTAAAGMVGMTLLMLIWAGCSIEKNYATLSFFFDGVPDPKAKAQAAAAAGVTDDLRKSPTYSLHKPYAEELCVACHKGQLKITSRDSKMCFGCHKEQTSNHARMHGPVAAGACLWCHNPHESAEANLMRAPARQVCTQCHDKTLLSSDGIPAHADDTRSCLECHFGHGGASPLFLKEGHSLRAPAGKEPAPTP